MKSRVKQEKGITLVALIITIILLVLLSAVTLKVVVDYGLINFVTTAAQTYTNEQQRENDIFNDITDRLTLQAPNVEVSGDMKNGYYVGKVTVKITDASKENSRITKIKYTIDGENYIEEMGKEVEFTLEEDGDYTIIAYAMDIGDSSSPASERKEFMKDTTPPSKAAITSETHTSDTITVTVEGEDGLSGVKDYIYQYKISSDNDEDNQWTTADTKEEAEYTYPNTKITAGNVYDVRVIVRDNAENSTPSGKVTVVTNRTPAIAANASGSVSGVNTINVKATGADPDGDTLTYKLYWGKTTNYELTSDTDTKTGASGAEITFSKTGLAEFTTYYWKITVTDGKSEPVNAGAGNNKTYSTPVKSGNPSGAVVAATTKSVNDAYKIRITAKATDADGDKLTYTISYGTNTNYGTNLTVQGNAGAQVTKEFTGGNYTTYYWKVTVTDGRSGAILLGTGNTRTYCKTTKCGGPFTKPVTCTACNGSGWRSAAGCGRTVISI